MIFSSAMSQPLPKEHPVDLTQPQMGMDLTTSHAAFATDRSYLQPKLDDMYTCHQWLTA